VDLERRLAVAFYTTVGVIERYGRPPLQYINEQHYTIPRACALRYNICLLTET